jgi:hypothetical protein
MVGGAHGGIIFRIDGQDVHSVQKLHRRTAGDPGNGLYLCGFGFDIIVRQKLFHFVVGVEFGHGGTSPPKTYLILMGHGFSRIFTDAKNS